MERSLLHRKIGGIPLYSLVVEKILQLNATIHVFSSHDSRLDYSSYPVFHHKVNVSDNKFSHLPNGANECIVHLRKNDFKEEHLLVLDYRVTNIDIESINKAYKVFENSPELPLLSINEARDNPAQLETFQRTITADVLCLIESQKDRIYYPKNLKSLLKINKLAITKPFPFNWEMYGFPKEIFDRKLFSRTATEFGYSMIPLDQFTYCHDLLAEEHQLILKESYNAARRIIPSSQLSFSKNRTVVAISSSLPFRNMFCLVTKEQSISINLNEILWSQGKFDLTLYPYSSHLPQLSGSDGNITLSISDALPRKSFSWYGSAFCGPVATIEHTKNIDGFVFYITKKTNGNAADFASPLPLPGHCDLISATSSRTNMRTGLQITGRQTCPKFYETNKAFAFLRVADYENLEKNLISGNSKGFIFHCVRIQSEFDLVCRSHILPEPRSCSII